MLLDIECRRGVFSFVLCTVKNERESFDSLHLDYYKMILALASALVQCQGQLIRMLKY